MSKQMGLLATGALLALGFLAAAGRADEEKVPLDKLPRAVLDAVKARFPDAKLVEADKETEDGKTTYEVVIKNKDQKIDVQLSPDGEIIALEKTIDVKDLPRAVAKALEDKYPGATYKTVEEIIKVKGKEEKLDCYEVSLVTAEKKKYEVQISSEGKITKTEEIKAKEKD